MNDSEIRETVLSCLREIAPNVDPHGLSSTADFREELDLDSMDFLRFVQAIDRKLGISIPEAEYRLTSTLGGCVDYLRRALAAKL